MTPAKNYQLVHTLTHYLECGGSYDGSAATLRSPSLGKAVKAKPKGSESHQWK
jgi:hypothetical protein